MIFATYWFLAFAAVFFPLFWLCRNPALRLAFLLVVSAIFHTHYAGPAGVMPIAVMGVIVYGIGLLENRTANALGIVLCVLMLGGYKYCVFLSANLLGVLNADFGAKVSETVRATLPATPPLAISFFTFEFVHYLVDRRRGSAPIRNPKDFALFAIFFPTLVAGPIKRYEQFLPSLRAGVGSVSARDVMTGLLQASFGCVKKVCADNFTSLLDNSQDRFTMLPLADRWLVFAAIAFRILLDFSGYSDIAIGLARMMGVAIPANFNWPYLSTNIREFWHRWHISLSSWIRDYVYIPLGGNRHGNLRRFLNGLTAFSLCGLWHGAGWNFVLWGLYHGLGSLLLALLSPASLRHRPDGRKAIQSRAGLRVDSHPPFRVVRLAAFFLSGTQGLGNGCAFVHSDSAMIRSSRFSFWLVTAALLTIVPSVLKLGAHVMFRGVLSLLMGIMVGILFSYLIYRLSLPVEPFVYVAF